MAKYEVLMSCGHEDTVELIGKNTDRERKLQYYKKSGLCKECYRKKMQELREKEPFSLRACVLPVINEDTGEVLVNIWFTGDTMSHKEEIKSLGGYRWGERQAALDKMSTATPPMCWNKTVCASKLKEEIEKATSIGCEQVDLEKNLWESAHYQIALNMQKEWKEKREKIDSIKKPDIPEIVKNYKWNKKIYGKAGNYSIYPDGQRVFISDEQANELREYLALKEEYAKKVKEIK